VIQHDGESDHQQPQDERSNSMIRRKKGGSELHDRPILGGLRLLNSMEFPQTHHIQTKISLKINQKFFHPEHWPVVREMSFA
jgi:hypothetical protein